MVAKKTLKERLAIIRHYPEIFFGEKKILLVISHMRSRSSLLSHILGSHPEISGYAELSQPYEQDRDLKNLRYKVWRLNGQNLSGSFVLDKILHNRYAITDSVLLSSSVYVCFLLRRPEDAVKSIMRLAQLHEGARLWESAEQASLYYQDRVKQMISYVPKTSRRCFFVQSDDLIENTDSVLMALSQWLSLEKPLSGKYSVFEKTGKPGFGDPSEIISTGKVVSGRNSYDTVSIPAELSEQLHDCYEQAKNVFEEKCLSWQS